MNWSFTANSPWKNAAASSKNSWRTPSGSVINAGPRARFWISRIISICIEVLCSPNAAKIARRPPCTAHGTIARQCGLSSGLISSAATSKPDLGASLIFPSRKVR